MERDPSTRNDRTLDAASSGGDRAAWSADLALPDRYEAHGLLGRGGQGLVHRVLDRDLGREVALKTVHRERHSPATAAEFLQEARSAAGLEHPNIVPIHDVGTLPDGRPYYTMRLVTGRTLGEIIDGLVEAEDRGDASAAVEWSLVRLVQVVQQVCRALQVAHEHGVIHRDVKPSNILLGELGEALVVDWGIAKSSTDGAPATTTGVIKGTVTYLAPEQARSGPVDARADVYAVGVVLYEVLTLRLPFEGETSADLLAAILRDEPLPPQQRAPHRRVPPELADLALRLLSKDPAARLGSAKEVADELQAFLEGVRERERRATAAADLQGRGEAALARHEAALAEASRVREDIARLEEAHPPWQAVAEKPDLIAARARLGELESASWGAFLEGIHELTDALVHVPDHEAVRHVLADRFWTRFVEAETRREPALAATYRTLVERWHDGRYARELLGHGRLEVAVWPKDAEAVLHPLVERNLVLVDGPGQSLGRGDVAVDDLPMGSYVLSVTARGHEPARYPVCIRRCEAFAGELRLPRRGRLPDGYVYVPGTPAWLGGDPTVVNGLPRRLVSVPSFAVKRFPVTLSEYCAFLDACGGDPEEARVVPEAVELGCLCERGADGRFEPVAAKLPAADAEERGRLPVCGLDYRAVQEYVRWASETTGRRVRLPHAEEYELAARGVDERRYPWGDAFDVALSCIRESFATLPTLRAVGAVPTDCSPYGVRDTAGTIQEWTDTWVDRDRSLVEVRGGGWTSAEHAARCAFRGFFGANGRSVGLGFRTVVELDPDDLA